jgi:hypothetical protein
VRKVAIFVGILLAGLAALVGYIAWFASAHAGPDWMGSMMQQMMGSGGDLGMMGGIGFPLMTVFPLVLVGVVGVAVVGLAYFVLMPEIRTTPSVENPRLGVQPPSETWEVVARTLNPQERRVLEILRTRGGRYLQKYLRVEAGLSRLQTHRIVARFAERGLVRVTPRGNTNEVALAEWLFPASTATVPARQHSPPAAEESGRATKPA